MPTVCSSTDTVIEASPVALSRVHARRLREIYRSAGWPCQDLLGDLRRPEKRTAYLDLGGECWYVLGCDAKGRPIGAEDEVPSECGVMIMDKQRLVVVRPAPRRKRLNLPFDVWIALAKATPVKGLNDELQGLLGDCGQPEAGTDGVDRGRP